MGSIDTCMVYFKCAVADLLVLNGYKRSYRIDIHVVYDIEDRDGNFIVIRFF